MSKDYRVTVSLAFDVTIDVEDVFTREEAEARALDAAQDYVAPCASYDANVVCVEEA